MRALEGRSHPCWRFSCGSLNVWKKVTEGAESHHRLLKITVTGQLVSLFPCIRQYTPGFFLFNVNLEAWWKDRTSFLSSFLSFPFLCCNLDWPWTHSADEKGLQPLFLLPLLQALHHQARRKGHFEWVNIKKKTINCIHFRYKRKYKLLPMGWERTLCNSHRNCLQCKFLFWSTWLCLKTVVSILRIPLWGKTTLYLF